MITYAIGDIHGRADLLVAAFDFMIKDAKPYDGPVRTVFLGDYIDRGPNSRGVLGWLIRAKESVLPGHEIVFLRGNHDDMMVLTLRYNNPVARDTWLKYGGLDTLRNYATEDTFLTEGGLPDRTRLDMVALDAHMDFIESMPLWFEDDHRIYSHAGQIVGDGTWAHPGAPRDKRDQERVDEALMWLRYRNGDYDYRAVPKLVVHGHTPVKQAQVVNNGLDIDTHAYHAKGCLTVARFLDGDAPTFHEFRS